MDKLLELLGATKLNEDDQTNVKERLETLIEVKAQELSTDKLQEAKEQLVESYESKFEDYKEDITSKFSNFVDSVLEEEMVIPDKILEYAKKGELYHDLIEQFKVRLSVDEGLLDEEVKSLLKEAKDEILKLRGDLNGIIEENLEVKQDASELASELYLRRKCDGLTEGQKKRVLEMLSGITDRSEIDRKFKFVLEAGDYDEDMDDDEYDEDGKKKKKAKAKGKAKAGRMGGEHIGGKPMGEEDDMDYDEDEDEDEDDDDKKKGKGKVDGSDDEDDEKNESLQESDSPFKQHLEMYKKILREGKVV